MRYNEEYDYAGTRLCGSIVRRGTQPVFVQDVDGLGVVEGEDLLTGDRFTCQLEELDVNPAPLGYLNVGDTCVYLTRVPKRRDWRQGLRTKTLAVLNSSYIATNNDIARCILSEYPTIKGCIERLKEASSVAFSRKFALNSNRELLYKGCVVGVLLEGEKFRLHTQHQYLYELLEMHVGARL